jgi:hypothetical protein
MKSFKEKNSYNIRIYHLIIKVFFIFFFKNIIYLKVFSLIQKFIVLLARFLLNRIGVI